MTPEATTRPAARQPRLQPDRNALSKLKALLRKAAARTVTGLWSAIGHLIELVPPTACANDFAAAGYDAN